MKQLKNIFKFSAVVMLIAVMALTFISCSKEKEDNTTPGEITITVEVINKAGESKEHEIKTTGTTLADALLEAGLVEGNDPTNTVFTSQQSTASLPTTALTSHIGQSPRTANTL